LTDAAVGRLTSSFLGNMRDNYTIRQEEEDWCSDPDMDFDGLFHTPSLVIIY
jgi:hypothetical protein